jgi:very-short-patch-repair endonuclease
MSDYDTLAITIGSYEKNKSTNMMKNNESKKFISNLFQMFLLRNSECIVCKRITVGIIDTRCSDCITLDIFLNSKKKYELIIQNVIKSANLFSIIYDEELKICENDDLGEMTPKDYCLLYIKMNILSVIRKCIYGNALQKMKKLFSPLLFFFLYWNPLLLLQKIPSEKLIFCYIDICDNDEDFESHDSRTSCGLGIVFNIIYDESENGIARKYVTFSITGSSNNVSKSNISIPVNININRITEDYIYKRVNIASRYIKKRLFFNKSNEIIKQPSNIINRFSRTRGIYIDINDYHFQESMHLLCYDQRDRKTIRYFKDVWKYTRSEFFIMDRENLINSSFFNSLNHFIEKWYTSGQCICIVCNISCWFGHYGHCLSCFFEKTIVSITANINSDLDKLCHQFPCEKYDNNLFYLIDFFITQLNYGKNTSLLASIAKTRIREQQHTLKLIALKYLKQNKKNDLFSIYIDKYFNSIVNYDTLTIKFLINKFISIELLNDNLFCDNAHRFFTEHHIDKYIFDYLIRTNKDLIIEIDDIGHNQKLQIINDSCKNMIAETQNVTLIRINARNLSKSKDQNNFDYVYKKFHDTIVNFLEN